MFKSLHRGQGFQSQGFSQACGGDQPSVPFTRRPVSVRLTRGLGGRLEASETQVLNRSPVFSGLTKLLPVSALGEVVRRLEVATSGYGSLLLTVRGHWAACS